MKTIKLNFGFVALVDDDQFDRISQYEWMVVTDTGGTYARTHTLYNPYTKKAFEYRMHRLVMDSPQDKQVHHINGDGLDNRKDNLLVCSAYEHTQVHKTNRTLLKTSPLTFY